jgi:hypothetical protein
MAMARHWTNLTLEECRTLCELGYTVEDYLREPQRDPDRPSQYGDVPPIPTAGRRTSRGPSLLSGIVFVLAFLLLILLNFVVRVPPPVEHHRHIQNEKQFFGR